MFFLKYILGGAICFQSRHAWWHRLRFSKGKNSTGKQTVPGFPDYTVLIEKTVTKGYLGVSVCNVIDVSFKVKATSQSVNQFVNRSIDKSINQTIDRSINRSIDQSIRSIDQSIGLSIVKQVSIEAGKQFLSIKNQPANQPTNQPMN